MPSISLAVAGNHERQLAPDAAWRGARAPAAAAPARARPARRARVRPRRRGRRTEPGPPPSRTRRASGRVQRDPLQQPVHEAAEVAARRRRRRPTTGGGRAARGQARGGDRHVAARSAPRATQLAPRCCLPARGHRVAALGARRAPQSRARVPALGRASVSASTTRTSASRRGGQRVDEVLPEGAERGVERRPRHDQQVAGARAGDVEQAPRLGAGLLLLLRTSASQPGGWQPSRKPIAIWPSSQSGTVSIGAYAVVGGVVERDDRRLEALGLVDRQDADGVGVAGARRRQVGLLARVLRCAPRAGSRSRAASARRATRPGAPGPPPSRGWRSAPRRGACR